MSDSKFTRITITIPQEIVDWVDKKAKKEERSRSWMLSKMAEEIIKKTESEMPIPIPIKPLKAMPSTPPAKSKSSGSTPA